MKNSRLFCFWSGLVLLLLNIACSAPVEAAAHGTTHSSCTQQTSAIKAQIEFEETDSESIHLREHNGHYTLSATSLEDARGDFEFDRHKITNRPITRREYFRVWNALKDAGFWQTSSMHWPASEQKASQIAGIIQIKATKGNRSHKVAEYISQDGTWIGTHGRDRKRDAIRNVAKMILALIKRDTHAK